MIPPFADIVAGAGRNGLRVASLYAGVGGSLIGWTWAGYRVAFAHEPNDLARLDLARNFPDLELSADVEGLEAAGELDVLEGAPPAALELSGKAETQDDEDTLDAWTGELFADFGRLLGDIRPRSFVVAGEAALGRAKARGYLRDARDTLAAPGYRLTVREVETSWLEVPHSRRLLVFVGVRDDLELDPPFPSPVSPAPAVADVLPWVVRFRGDRPLEGPAPRLSAIGTTAEADTAVERTTGPADRFGPVSLGELRRLAGFPDGYALAGDLGRQRRAFDASVPPAVAYHVGRALEGVLR